MRRERTVGNITAWRKGNINQIACSPDGKVLAIAVDLGIWLYNASNLDEIGLLGEYAGDVAFSPDGKLLASAQWDNSGVFLWDIQRRKQVGLLKPQQFGASDVTSIAFSPDGKLLASGNCDKTVRLWDVDREKQLAVLQGHTGNPSSIVFSPDGKWLAAGRGSGVVSLWEVNVGDSGISIEPMGKQLGTWGNVKKTELLQNFPNPFNPETWIPFSLSEPDHVKIRIYTSTGRLVRTLDLGQKPSGAYLSKEKAAYWDGGNRTGETVASDVYFYTMEAGGHIGLKKMILAR